MGFDFCVPTRVLFGAGVCSSLHLAQLPGKKALLVTSCGKSVKVNGALDKVQKELKAANVDFVLFDKIMANPLKETIHSGASFAKENSCDFVVALGGGSVMDASKAIALMAKNKGDLWDYMAGGTGKGMAAVCALPLVAITTTAGTGSEVDCAAVITNTHTHEKMGLVHPSLFPVLAVVDANFMTSVPPKFTAFQGFDALFHSTEGYISRAASFMSDMFQESAIKNIGQYLPVAVKNGNDIAARQHIAFSNTLSGYSMVLCSCTSEHSLEHAMSAFHQDLPHGAGLIMISLEYYKHFIKKGAVPQRFIKMAQMLGKKDAKSPEDFLEALKDLQKACGVLDLRMSDYGIKKQEFKTMAENAKTSMGRLFELDPLPLSIEDCIDIYAKSYK